ncbi:SDR family NAD(P)-dependent oxidoreductase [Alkalilimnicola ehrlichii MLHE-1]|uniref:Short-chain dehydrogenase/reductase SDR n=1 Tax=Alkalilimnicola ehrlichii (strain ATCC BAA-1101 / DSM 17681 / MLHE-1) TaxID=187272 RepID=Q0A916_ALKEH|nr:SDR family NAD(P)-dependent oxidoreductase [Alkalilimnicola ehrlichii]ABI56671.1 short-chain dehydrogenase/reductase SDR [Alkalilimnicola ehrlichii MLHE-1]
MAAEKIALVTGGSRGIGVEVARQLARKDYRVVITSRDGLAGKAAADKLRSENLEVFHQPLELTRQESVRRLAGYLQEQFGRLDALVNNAGQFIDPDPDDPRQASVLEAPLSQLQASLDVNLLGTVRVCQAVVPLMRGHAGCIVNVSSGYGQLQGMKAAFPGYRISKTALNALTRLLAAELEADGIRVNSVDPGWTRTRMGGSQAPRSPAEAANGIVWAATLPADGPSGGFFRDGTAIPW